MKSHWETYKGQRIFAADYTRMPPDVFAIEVGEVTAELLRQPHQSVLLLVNVEGMVVGPKQLELFKQTASRCQMQTRKTAVLGVTGAKKLLMEIVIQFSGMSMTVFKTAEEAKEWLVS